MTGTNLPDGVTVGDIDDHFGEPDMKTIYGTVEVAVEARVPDHTGSDEMVDVLLEAAGEGDIEQVLNVAHIEEE